jgi:hypothetical protein
MSVIERIPPGQVLAHIPFDDCLLARPRRRMPTDVARWASGLPVPAVFSNAGLARPLREAVAPLWEAFLARFRQGLRIEAGNPGRVVVHCDSIRYELAPCGSVHARMPRPGSGYEPISVEIGTPFPHWQWVHVLAKREPEAVAPLMQSIQVHRLAGMAPAIARTGGLEPHALEWLARIIEGLARRCIDGIRMREHLRAALAVDRRLLHAARLALPRRNKDFDLASPWWNACIKHREAMLELQARAPGLLPIFGQLVGLGVIVEPLRDVATLRETICKQLTPADWKRLAKDSPRPVWGMYHARRIRNLEALQGFIDGWARLHRGLPEGMRMPLEMFEPLARTCVAPLSDHALPPLRWPGSPRATRQAIEHYLEARACGNGPRFIEEEWGPVVRWAADYTGGGRKLVSHWSTLRRLAAEDERKLRAALFGQRWASPLPRFEDAGFQAVAICTGQELVEEAIAMRHCADRFAAECARGDLVVYSVRDSGSSKRRLSVSIAISGDEARLAEVARSLNRQPDEEELAFAKRLAKAVADQVKADARAKTDRELPIPPAGNKVIYMERRDDDFFAFVEATPTGWRGYKVLPSGDARPISGREAVETLNPNSWFPIHRDDFISAVSALRTLRRASAGAGQL